MTSSEDYGWYPDRPCPEWCVTGDQHLAFRMHAGNDFWHQGRTTSIETAYLDHNWIPTSATLYLSQHEQVDERGHYRHPVVIGGNIGEFTADQAREIAAALLEHASTIEALRQASND